MQAVLVLHGVEPELRYRGGGFGRIHRSCQEQRIEAVADAELVHVDQCSVGVGTKQEKLIGGMKQQGVVVAEAPGGKGEEERGGGALAGKGSGVKDLDWVGKVNSRERAREHQEQAHRDPCLSEELHS